MERTSLLYHRKWNETGGNLKTRPGRLRMYGDINTDGFGVLEMLQWCQDMDQTPMLRIFVSFYTGDDLISEANLRRYVDIDIDGLFRVFRCATALTVFGAQSLSLSGSGSVSPVAPDTSRRFVSGLAATCD